MRSLYLLAAIAAFGLSACDSHQENARENALEKRADGLENQADATRKASEKQADAIESSGKHGVDKLNPNTPADKEANAVRKSGDAKADALESQAEATRAEK